MNPVQETTTSADKKPLPLCTIGKFLLVAALWLLCLAWYMFQPAPEHVENLYSRWAYR